MLKARFTFNHKNLVKIYIAYEINLWPFTRDDDFVLADALFGNVKLIKTLTKINANIQDME